MSFFARRLVRPSIGIMSAAMAARVHVSAPPEGEKREPKPHWVKADGTLFKNPWDSFRKHTPGELVGLGWKTLTTSDPNFERDLQNIPQVKPTFGAGMSANQIKATWLGHACFLVEMPSSKLGVRGVRILFDPVFSNRCSPSQWIGPARFTPAPCKVEELPEIDVVVVSHNHYDHLDVPTLELLVKKQPDLKPTIFMPLNTLYALPKALQRQVAVTELDWWEEREVTVEQVGGVRITCTPAQHMTARGAFDQMQALWASWAVTGLPGDEDGQEGDKRTSLPAKIWFGGDTGYCAVHSDEAHGIDPALPVCPAFKEIGEKFQGFDLGLIPIGAYDPRTFMSPMHCNPMDSVRVFQDTRCKKALGMHWGTWRLTSEPVDEPPKRLAEARTELSVSNADFGVCAIGETRAFTVGGS